MSDDNIEPCSIPLLRDNVEDLDSYDDVMNSTEREERVFLKENEGNREKKRQLENSEESETGDAEEGWTKVRGKGKRTCLRSEIDVNVSNHNFEIYISSKDKMPKQFALARTFQQLNITSINHVKYITPYKVRLHLENEETMKNILECEELIRKGWRIYKAMELSYCYGVIRDVDLDLSEEEILNNISCPFSIEILSLKRLNRKALNVYASTFTPQKPIEREVSIQPTTSYENKNPLGFNQGSPTFAEIVKTSVEIHDIQKKSEQNKSSSNFIEHRRPRMKRTQREQKENQNTTNRQDGFGGVAICVHKSVHSSLQRVRIDNSGMEILCVKLSNFSPIDYILSVYCPPSLIISKSDWDRLLSLYTKKTLILGDFNAHHSNWSNKIDYKGSLMFDALVDSNFITLNNGEATRMRLVNGRLQQSSPDITLVSSDIALQFNWRVINETLGSDHLMVKVSCISNSLINPIVKRNFRKANWTSYKNDTEILFTDLILPVDLQKGYDLFISKINEAAAKNIPLVKYNQNPESKFTPRSFWTKELSHEVAQRRLALAIFRRNPSPNNYIKLKKHISVAQRDIRYARNKDFQNSWSSVDESTTSNEMWHKMSWMKGFRKSKRHINDIEAEKLLRSLAPDYVSPPCPDIRSTNITIECPISIQEQEQVMYEAVSGKLDGCSQLLHSVLSNISIVFNNVNTVIISQDVKAKL
ncbi:unnamed protein product, partial [Brenthis ino]